jgi:hypothetical protein
MRPSRSPGRVIVGPEREGLFAEAAASWAGAQPSAALSRKMMLVQRGRAAKTPAPMPRTALSSSMSSAGTERTGDSAKRILAEAMLPSLAGVVPQLGKRIRPEPVPAGGGLGEIGRSLRLVARRWARL